MTITWPPDRISTSTRWTLAPAPPSWNSLATVADSFGPIGPCRHPRVGHRTSNDAGNAVRIRQSDRFDSGLTPTDRPSTRGGATRWAHATTQPLITPPMRRGHRAQISRLRFRSQRFGPVSFPDLPPVPEPDSLLEPIEAEVVPLPTDERPHRGSAKGPSPSPTRVPATEQVLPSWVPRGDNAEAPPTAYVPPWAGQDNSTAGHPGTGGFNTGGPGRRLLSQWVPRYRAVQRRFPAATGPQPAQLECSAVSGRVRADDSHPPVAPPAG